MQYFVHGVDSDAATEQLDRLAEEHWAYMDGYVDDLVARGPTLSPDGEAHTGSIHLLSTSSAEEARRFAFSEPYQRAGVYASVTRHALPQRPDRDDVGQATSATRLDELARPGDLAGAGHSIPLPTSRPGCSDNWPKRTTWCSVACWSPTTPRRASVWPLPLTPASSRRRASLPASASPNRRLRSLRAAGNAGAATRNDACPGGPTRVSRRVGPRVA